MGLRAPDGFADPQGMHLAGGGGGRTWPDPLQHRADRIMAVGYLNPHHRPASTVHTHPRAPHDDGVTLLLGGRPLQPHHAPPALAAPDSLGSSSADACGSSVSEGATAATAAAHNGLKDVPAHKLPTPAAPVGTPAATQRSTCPHTGLSYVRSSLYPQAAHHADAIYVNGVTLLTPDGWSPAVLVITYDRLCWYGGGAVVKVLPTGQVVEAVCRYLPAGLLRVVLAVASRAVAADEEVTFELPSDSGRLMNVLGAVLEQRQCGHVRIAVGERGTVRRPTEHPTHPTHGAAAATAAAASPPASPTLRVHTAREVLLTSVAGGGRPAWQPAGWTVLQHVAQHGHPQEAAVPANPASHSSHATVPCSDVGALKTPCGVEASHSPHTLARGVQGGPQVRAAWPVGPGAAAAPAVQQQLQQHHASEAPAGASWRIFHDATSAATAVPMLPPPPPQQPAASPPSASTHRDPIMRDSRPAPSTAANPVFNVFNDGGSARVSAVASLPTPFPSTTSHDVGGRTGGEAVGRHWGAPPVPAGPVMGGLVAVEAEIMTHSSTASQLNSLPHGMCADAHAGGAYARQTPPVPPGTPRAQPRAAAPPVDMGAAGFAPIPWEAPPSTCERSHESRSQSASASPVKRQRSLGGGYGYTHDDTGSMQLDADPDADPPQAAHPPHPWQRPRGVRFDLNPAAGPAPQRRSSSPLKKQRQAPGRQRTPSTKRGRPEPFAFPSVGSASGPSAVVDALDEQSAAAAARAGRQGVVHKTTTNHDEQHQYLNFYRPPYPQARHAAQRHPSPAARRSTAVAQPQPHIRPYRPPAAVAATPGTAGSAAGGSQGDDTGLRPRALFGQSGWPASP